MWMLGGGRMCSEKGRGSCRHWGIRVESSILHSLWFRDRDVSKPMAIP
jgi:hypothetical protein